MTDGEAKQLEEFTKAAMQGLCAAAFVNGHWIMEPDQIAQNALLIAKKTIAELNKEDSN